MAVDDIKSLNPVLSTILPSRDLTPVQKVALSVNETLGTLNSLPASPRNALLINETNPSLTTFVEAQDLSLSQQAALTINETFQTLTNPQSGIGDRTTVDAEDLAQNLNAAPQDTTLTDVPPTRLTTDIGTTGLNFTTTGITPPTQLTTPTTETTVASTGLNPSQIALTQPILDRNIIAVNAYEIRDPKPNPPDPKPKRKEVMPPPPTYGVRAVGSLILRQEWEKRKNRLREVKETRPPLEERSLRQMVSQVNEDMATNGLPLHLVLAKNKEGYSLDIYDCSDDELCRLAQEVPLDLNNLLTILDNLQHETGIIVNIMA